MKQQDDAKLKKKKCDVDVNALTAFKGTMYRRYPTIFRIHVFNINNNRYVIYFNIMYVYYVLSIKYFN